MTQKTSLHINFLISLQQRSRTSARNYQLIDQTTETEIFGLEDVGLPLPPPPPPVPPASNSGHKMIIIIFIIIIKDVDW
jgi:hypothetical protein